jgi:diketogulonate reductase-like aldo/keto reductase
VAVSSIPTTALHTGRHMPTFGLGTWRMGESAVRRGEEVAALRHGIERGITLIDTAEMYGDGEAERIVAEAVGKRRDEMFIVSKVLPGNSSRRGTLAACEASLKRLKTDRIDLYLLHWRGSVPLEETIEAFAALQESGKIADWGVSNFDISEMGELWKTPEGDCCVANQVAYNLSRRGIEFDLMSWCRKHRLPIMAYSPIEQGRLLGNAALRDIGKKHNATPAQVALAWLMRHDDVIVIPKASSAAHVDEDFNAIDLLLTHDDFVALDRAFPPPRSAQPLDML